MRNIKPFEEDLTITRKFLEKGKLFEMAVLEHLIIGSGFSSFAYNG
jgi:DNA repair protein RadC